MKRYDNQFCEAWDASDNTVFLSHFSDKLESLSKRFYYTLLQIKDNINQYDEEVLYNLYRLYKDKADKEYKAYFNLKCMTILDRELLNCLIINFEERLEKRVNRLLKAYTI